MTTLTILTRRVSIADAFIEFIKNILRFFRAIVRGGVVDFSRIRYGGHVAVTRSILRGLKECRVDYNYNPVSIKNIGDVVVVLSGVSALKQAIELRRRGKIKKLLAGPNIIEMPTEYNDILAAPEVDICLVPSESAVAIYEHLDPALRGKVVAWYAGVDELFWNSKSRDTKSRDVLVYWKNAPRVLCLEAERLLRQYGYNPLRITYGEYSKKKFKTYLQRSVFAIFMSITETQGIALAEAWAVNVPTVVWDPQIEHYYIRDVYTTAAPYLSEETGIRWKEMREFESFLKKDADAIAFMHPREWVLGHMTDKKSAEELIRIYSA